MCPYKHKETEFVVFCVENTAKKLGVSGNDVYMDLMRTGGIASFLYPSYEALHTQSKEYMVDETLKYMQQHHSPLLNRETGADSTVIDNPLVNETLLQMKYARVVSLLAERYHLHNMSDAYLVDEIINELKDNR